MEEESPNFHESHDDDHHHHQHVPAEADHGLLRRPPSSISANGLCYSYWSNNQDWSNSSSSSISCHSGGLNPRGYDRDREDEAADKLLSEFSFPKFVESLMSSTLGIAELNLSPSHPDGKEHGDDDHMSVLGEKLKLRTLFVEKSKDRYDHEYSRDYSGIFGHVYPNMDFSNERRSVGVLLDCYEASAPAAFDFLGDKNSPRLRYEVREVVSEDSTFELIRGIHPSTGHHSSLGIAAPPFAGKKSSSDSKRPNNSSEAKVDREVAPKKIKVEATPPWKVRKEKLGDKISALQQLVSPFGKTDTASVLMEATGYIKFLQNQVQTLCVPYMKSENAGPPSRGLRPRGLCLVPLSCMSLIMGDEGAGGGGGFWPHVPYYGFERTSGVDEVMRGHKTDPGNVVEEERRTRMGSLKKKTVSGLFPAPSGIRAAAMVDTRVAELKKEQEATQTVVSSLVDRLEAITVQIKEMQDQACQKWEGVQLQLVSMENAIQERREGRTDREQSVTWEGNAGLRPIRDSKSSSENRGNSLPKLEFPDFDGTNLEDWVYRSDHFFELERTSDSEKVRIASIYMYGKALQWHYTFIRNRGRAELPSWEEYVEALTRRFGKAVFEDPMGRLKNLKQEGAYDNLYVSMEEFD